MTGKAVVLMYYGFPERREGMRDYLKDILHGREPPESLIRDNLMKLDTVGGQTPSTGIVKSIRASVASKIESEGFSVYLLAKHTEPSIKIASEIISEEEIYEVPLFPVYSKFIFDGYFKPLEEQLDGRKFVRISDIGFDRKLIEYYRDRTAVGDGTLLTFSAHSIPLEGYDPYSESVLKLSHEIAGDRKFINIYHSQGPFHQNWLTPYPEYSIAFAKERGFRKMLVVPIGFIYEHLEVLYDLDYKLKNDAKREGIDYERVPLPNDSSVVIEAIINSISKQKF
jgi:ferrochelatase